jgi:hypothetical protein
MSINNIFHDFLFMQQLIAQQAAAQLHGITMPALPAASNPPQSSLTAATTTPLPAAATTSTAATRSNVMPAQEKTSSTTTATPAQIKQDRFIELVTQAFSKSLHDWNKLLSFNYDHTQGLKEDLKTTILEVAAKNSEQTTAIDSSFPEKREKIRKILTCNNGLRDTLMSYGNLLPSITREKRTAICLKMEERMIQRYLKQEASTPKIPALTATTASSTSSLSSPAEHATPAPSISLSTSRHKRKHINIALHAPFASAKTTTSTSSSANTTVEESESRNVRQKTAATTPLPTPSTSSSASTVSTRTTTSSLSLGASTVSTRTTTSSLSLSDFSLENASPFPPSPPRLSPQAPRPPVSPNLLSPLPETSPPSPPRLSPQAPLPPVSPNLLSPNLLPPLPETSPPSLECLEDFNSLEHLEGADTPSNLGYVLFGEKPKES